MKRVGYQGVKGAFSEAALFDYYGKNIEAVGLESFEDVFEALKTGKIDAAILPFENSIAGTIAINYDLLYTENSIKVIGETFHRIDHHLLTHKGNHLTSIKRVYSHPLALAQCRDFIKQHNLKAMPEYDTAGAAKIVSERKNPEEAVIASSLAAEIYNMDLIVRGIESNKFNYTRFLILVRSENVPDNLPADKTSIVFKTKHFPGALVNCLQRFSKNSVNLTKLESRPVPEDPFQYMFYADFEGGLHEERVKLSLNEVEAVCEFMKILGSYPK